MIGAAVVAAGLGALHLPLPAPVRLPPPTGRSPACPCDEKELCQVQSTWPQHEILGFGGHNFEEYDWSQVTTVAWGTSPALMCKAHTHKARVVAATSAPITANQTAIQGYIDSTLASLRETFFDGVTFDWENPVAGLDDPQNAMYLDVINQTTMALKRENPGYQTSVCAAWSPAGIDGRWYDYKALAEAVDFLYVMCYDTRSQIFDRCTASANAPMPRCQDGIEHFLQLGVPANKLVLGVPWYGYKYPCEGATDAGVDQCFLAEVPFRGVNCSDAAGKEIPYSSIIQSVDAGQNSTEIRRDPYLRSPYVNMVENGTVYQVWYDDANSLGPLYEWAGDRGLRGTGPYTFDDLQGLSGAQAAPMWAALQRFKAASERKAVVV
mmetsp:Transcript_129470/g.295450  ORF Transcript_129470/g.295450 Transcript_129470/m.295450 type:complete len:380 (+) Transcript_129470:31-1170(+)